MVCCTSDSRPLNNVELSEVVWAPVTGSEPAPSGSSAICRLRQASKPTRRTLRCAKLSICGETKTCNLHNKLAPWRTEWRGRAQSASPCCCTATFAQAHLQLSLLIYLKQAVYQSHRARCLQASKIFCYFEQGLKLQVVLPSASLWANRRRTLQMVRQT